MLKRISTRGAVLAVPTTVRHLAPRAARTSATAAASLTGEKMRTTRAISNGLRCLLDTSRVTRETLLSDGLKPNGEAGPRDVIGPPRLVG